MLAIPAHTVLAAPPDATRPPAATNLFSAGAALIVSESPYRGTDPRFLPVPFLTYRGPRLQVTGLRASYSLLRNPSYSVSAIGQWRFSPYDADDSPALDGMHSRDPGLEAGVRLAGPRFLPLETGLEIRGDSLGAHDGIAVALDLGRRVFVKNGFFRPALRLEWQSPELAEYLYGVSAAEARPGRPAYEPDDAFSVNLDGIYVRTLADRWEWTFMTGVNLLDSEVTDSPIVEQSAVWRTLMGIGYRF